jgi:hypothetical protein
VARPQFRDDKLWTPLQAADFKVGIYHRAHIEKKKTIGFSELLRETEKKVRSKNMHHTRDSLIKMREEMESIERQKFLMDLFLRGSLEVID